MRATISSRTGPRRCSSASRSLSKASWVSQMTSCSGDWVTMTALLQSWGRCCRGPHTRGCPAGKELILPDRPGCSAPLERPLVAWRTHLCDTWVMQEKQAPEDVFMATLLTLGRRMRQRIEGDELDYSLIPVLKSLWENGSTRHTTLAERLMLDASTVSRKVRYLEDRGLVGFRNDEQDGRARQVEILPEGRRLLRQMVGRRHRLI